MTTNLNQKSIAEGKKFLYSIKALADLLGCTAVTAQNIKKSGKIPYYQIGRKVIFDPDKVLEALEIKSKN